MRRLLAALLLALLPLAAIAQDDDAGFLQRLLQDSLSDAGRTVTIEGFRGALSAQAELDRLTVADDAGPWLTLEGVVLDWDRSALFQRRVEVRTLAARRIVLERLPAPAEMGPELPAATAREFSLPELPVSIRIDSLVAEEIALGAPVLGEPVRLTLEGAFSLAGGDGSAELEARRIDDGPEGLFRIDASFENESETLALELRLEEAPGGIAARLLGVPGAPSVALVAEGAGPLSDFRTDLSLATDGTPRIAGTVTLLEPPETPGATAFEADIAGDVTALVLPQYRAFFGDDVALEVAGIRSPDGALELQELSLGAEALALDGSLALSAQGWPERLALTGRIAAADGAPVRLPLGGAPTTVGALTLDVAFDAARGERWTGGFELEDFARPDIAVRTASIAGGGRILGAGEGRIGRADIGLDIVAGGVVPADPALAEALGEALTGRVEMVLAGGDAPIEIEALRLAGTGYSAEGSASIGSIEDGLPTDLALDARIETLERFAGLAGQPLSGAASLSVAGQVAPLSGAFDLVIDGTARDLAVAQPSLDPFLAGQTSLSAAVARDLEATRVERFSIEGTQIRAAGEAIIAPETGRAIFEARLADIGLAVPGLSGPVTLDADAERDGTDWTIGVDAAAPGGVSAAFDGRLAESGTLDLTLETEIGELARFSRLAGLPLGGAASLRVEGMANLSDAGFDLGVEGQTRDLSIGQAEVDRLLAGTYALDARISRTWQTLSLDALTLDGANLTARASAQDGPGTGAASLTARLRDVGLIAPEFSGPLSLEAAARRAGAGWQVTADATGPGGTTLALSGRVPEDGPPDLAFQGAAPLGLANSFIAPRSIAGQLRYDLALRGAPALGNLTGTLSVAGARFSAPVLRQALEEIDATIRLEGTRAVIAMSGAPAAGGTLRIDGPVGLAQPFPADITVALQSVGVTDPRLYETTISGQIGVQGPLAGGASITGRLGLGRTEIRVPSSGVSALGELPDIVHVSPRPAARRTLERAGLSASGTPDAGGNGSGPVYPLDVRIDATQRVFIRGRGLDAELGGSIRLSGTTADILPEGRFELIRGRLNLLQQRFELTEGWAQLAGDFDPVLRLVAETETDELALQVVVSGPASEPQVTFLSQPELPEDEILAQLIFGRDLSSLSAFQALQLASAVAELAGRGGGGLVARLREGSGLDDLDVVTDEDGNAAVRAGKYLTENIYTDVTVDGAGRSEINLNLDLTETLRAKGSFDNSGESSLGLFFQRDY